MIELMGAGLERLLHACGLIPFIVTLTEGVHDRAIHELPIALSRAEINRHQFVIYVALMAMRGQSRLQGRKLLAEIKADVSRLGRLSKALVRTRVCRL